MASECARSLLLSSQHLEGWPESAPLSNTRGWHPCWLRSARNTTHRCLAGSGAGYPLPFEFCAWPSGPSGEPDLLSLPRFPTSPLLQAKGRFSESDLMHVSNKCIYSISLTFFIIYTVLACMLLCLKAVCMCTNLFYFVNVTDFNPGYYF